MKHNYSSYSLCVNVPGEMNFHVHLATCIDHTYMCVTLSVETLCIDSVYAASPAPIASVHAQTYYTRVHTS